MSAENFDVVIIGGGNAGIGLTGPARRAGLSVAMIEARDLGGTCPNRGCTPKKGAGCCRTSTSRHQSGYAASN
jgi:glutathione reductase (NADPH)